MKSLLRLMSLSAALSAIPGVSVPLSAAPLEAPRHWDHMPVRVYFQVGGSSDSDRIFSAENGFLEWTTSSHGALQYTLVRSAADADVVVRFTPTVPASHGSARVGETLTESEGEILKKATVRLATNDADLSQLTEEAAHEWGHALGITEHSADPKDLMYPSTVRVFDENTGTFRPTPARLVSSADLHALETAYGVQFRAAFARRQ